MFEHLYDQQAFLLNLDVSVDIVLDNAGFELLTDLCLADFLVSKRLCSRVTFYVKCLPWFVSDAMKTDFMWLIEQVESSSTNAAWPSAAKRWREHLNNGQWIVQSHPFFTLPYDYSHTQAIAPELYCTMSQAALVIFKGDLNYRKLVGDLRWPVDTPFDRSLRGFQPTSLVALRTLKADVQVGMEKKLAAHIAQADPRWMVNGQWGVIQASLTKSAENEKLD